jgi:hypothetical protein
MEKWTIKLKTLKAGPGGVIFPGELYDEYEDVAKQLIDSGQAILIEKLTPHVKETPKIEERIIQPEEQEVIRSLHKAKGRPKKAR